LPDSEELLMKYLLLFLAIPLMAQTPDYGRTAQTGSSFDLSGALHTMPSKSGLSSATPGTCTANKETYIKTDATPGQQLFLCNSAGTGWNLLGDGGSGGGSGSGIYSGVVDFGVIPDLGCSTLTYSATGLAVGTSLATALPSGLETGLTVIAWASAADTVSVRACNASGAAVNPASATYKVRDIESLGYMTWSGTLNFGSIADGNCAELTMTATGAAALDQVAAAWPAALETGLVGSMYVSAVNTLAVRLCNFSGAAVDPASATFKASMTR
jgi:hypothetical protein